MSEETLVPREALDRLPTGPGVYSFYDRNDELLYVGQSATLRARVRSYFAPAANHSRRRGRMVRAVRRIGYTALACELEARIVEARLIKLRRPRYNVLLRSHRAWWFLRLNRTDPYPRLELTHAPAADGATYYGPFRGRATAELALDALHAASGLRSCDGRLHPRADHPGCWYGELGLCLRPCDLSCDAAGYMAAVDAVAALIHSHPGGLVARLAEQRDLLAAQLQFEAAADVHRRLTELSRVLGRRQRVSCAVDRLDALVVRSPRLVVVAGGRYAGLLDIHDPELASHIQLAFAAVQPDGRRWSGDEIEELRIVAIWLDEQRDDEVVQVVRPVDGAGLAALLVPKGGSCLTDRATET